MTREWTGDADVDAVLDAVLETAPEVRAALADRREYADRENPSGERVRAADEYADELLEERLLALDSVAAYASEEREEISESQGEYHVAVDPLDGSSNLKSNNPMGTIVGVYDDPLPAAGRHLVASAFVLYGPNTTMVVADGDRVTEYLINEGDRRVLEADLTLPSDPIVYGFGGRRPDWTADVTEFVETIEDERLKLRYGGAFIADVMQVLTHGGLFSYPELEERPEGKLRYLFECAPIGFLVESAGGRASNGQGDLLDATPGDLHARIPIYVGNESLVDRLEDTLG